jgi:hypothetical protein
VADVSADGDPATGAAIYTATTIPSQGRSGWFQIGGTSLSAPLIAGVFALAGGTPSGVSPNATLYAHRSRLHDVTSGSNGQCANKPICQAGRGYDGPTGLGTPNGLAAFTAGVTGLDPRHPGVAISPSRVPAAGLRTLRVALSNRNAFKVSGAISLVSASRLHYPGRRSPLRIVAFGKHGIAIAAGQHQSVSFALSPSLRALIARAHPLKLIATVSLRDAHGGRATARLRLTII